MAKAATILGLMSGTSMDGIDLALLRTDGEALAEPLGDGCLPYPKEVRDELRAVLGRGTDADGQVARAEQTVTDWHIRAVREFLEGSPHKVDLIGFHGQTIFHDPGNGRTWQIGDGERLARETGIDVIYDFRSADMRAGGQGAPLLPLYHRALAKMAGLDEPVCILNLGGVGNITWIGGDTVIACDTGPASALIDDWMLRHTGTAMDVDGATAARGRPDEARLAQWLADPFFAAPAPKSLDRNAFAHCTADGLSLEDGAATLTEFTVRTVLKTLMQMPEMPMQMIVAGGGRHNAELMRRLNRDIKVISADALGWRGDAMEAEGFAYLAARARDGKPLSLPTTTGCHTPVTGGRYAKAA